VQQRDGGQSAIKNGPRAHFLYRWSLVAGTIDKQKLFELLEPPVRALGFDLVDIEGHMGRPGLLRLYIEHQPVTSLADCELVSQQVSALLDVEDPLPGSYNLEVSSPGADRRLRTREHFERFRGERVKVELKQAREGRKRLTGQLIEVGDDQIVVATEQGAWELKLADIALARLVPQ
jgi:ribosome maturation factor RimP